MEKIISDQEYILKQANDGIIQLKQLNILKNILNFIQNLEKKALTQNQSKIEELLFKLITSNRITSDILARYTSYIYIYLFDKGRNSHLTDLINSVGEILEQKENNTNNNNKNISDNIKCTFFWIIGYVCKRCEYKSPGMSSFVDILINICNTKEISDLLLSESIKLISKFLNMNINNIFGNKIPEIYKLLLKKERNILNKKYIIKCIYGSLLYYENKDLIEINFYHKKYNFLMELLENYFQIKEDSINNLAIKTFIFLHDKIIFKQETIQEYLDIDSNLTDNTNKNEKKNKTLVLKSNELLNFLQVIQYFSQIDLMKFNLNKTDENSKRILTHLNIIIHYIKQNKAIINLNETIIDDLFELLLNCYSLNINLTSLTFIDGLDIYYNTNDITLIKSGEEEQIKNKKILEDEVNQKIILLFRIFIKSIYITSHRMHFLSELFSKLKEVQTYIDKLTEDNTITINDLSVLIENGIINKVYTIPQINILLLSLLEISESNPELFELNYNSFQDISNNISFFLTSGIRSFRIFLTKFVCNLSYFLPSYRTSILSLVLEIVEVSYNHILKFKNTLLFFSNYTDTTYKASVKIHKNLSFFKDTCNCLALLLCTIKHKSKGFSLRSVEESFNKAKIIILGKESAKDLNKKIFSEDMCNNLEEESNDYFNKKLIAHKECGWIIIQGICSLDHKFIFQEYKSLLFLFKYTFNKKSCELNADKLKMIEYKDNLISQFFNKKQTLHSLNKFIISFKNYPDKLILFKEDLNEILKSIVDFFIPNKENMDFISFYQHHLNDAFNDVRKIIYEIFYNLPIEYYENVLDILLNSLSYNIAGNNYNERYLYKYYLELLNKVDSFICLKSLNIDDNIFPNSYFIDSFYPISIYKNSVNEDNYFYQNYFNSNIFNFLFSSICLLIKLFSSEKLNMKNKNSIIKYFLNSVTDIVIKEIDFKSKDEQKSIFSYNKLLNIVSFVYLFLNHCNKNNIDLKQDLELFTNIKMIFDLCYKIDDLGMLNIISCEGTSYLINIYDKKNETLEHYLSLSEIKFNSTRNTPKKNDFIYNFYLIANIFRNVDFEYIRPYLDKYMNFIISYFNPNDDIARNAYVIQSLLVLCDCLIKQNEIDKVEKITQIFKMNIMYINGSNKNFFKNYSLHETLNEIKLLIIYTKVYENITENEKNLMKNIFKKIINDNLYTIHFLMKYILLLINEMLLRKIENDFSLYLFDKKFIEFLFEQKNNFTNNLLSLNIINYFLKNNSAQIESVMNQINKDRSYIKQKMSLYLHYLNNLYHNNKNYYYINKIFKIYYQNTNAILSNDINHMVNFKLFDKMFNNYRLIIMYKKIISTYLKKNYKNIDDSINFLKIILQKKMNLYKNIEENIQKDKSAEAGDESLKDNQDNLHINNTKIIFDLNNLQYIFSINLQKFLIKDISKNLIDYIQEIISTKINFSNKNIIEKTKIDILSKLMSLSMIIIQCEESWEIKYLGIKLLYKLIKIFSNIKDTRTDDDSLLIQQYEVQIFSCIKNIFNSKSKSPSNFKSIIKGINLIYLFLSISISNDIEYIQKFNEYIHFIDLIENKNNNINSKYSFCSEKEENIIKYRYFILLCELFVSCYTKKDFNIKYIQKSNKNKMISIHSSLMAEEIKNYLKDIFSKNISNFCLLLKKYIYEIYQYLIKKEENNNIDRNLYYSDKLRLKYASLFLTVISIILHNNLVNNSAEIFDKSFLMFLYKLIFYLIKCIKLYKDNKDAILYIIDIFTSIIGNNNIKINNEICSLFFDEFKNIIKIQDFKDNKNLLSLYNKFSDRLTNNEKEITKENNLILLKKETELIKLLKNNYSAHFDSSFIMIYFNYILRLLKQENEKEFKDEFKYYNKLLFEMYFSCNDNSVSKLLLEKVYTILININKNSQDEFNIFLNELINTLKKLNSNVQRYITLFYIIMQYISKTSNTDLINTIKKYYITESLKEENNLYEITNKSFLISIAQMNNINIIQFIQEYLLEVFNNKNKFSFSQEIQKLILLYIQNEKRNDSRKNIIKSLIKYLNENKDIMPIKDACTFILGIIKINSDDNNLINEDEVQKILNEEFKNQINELTKVNSNKESSNETNTEKTENNNENEGEGDDDEFDEVEG